MSREPANRNLPFGSLKVAEIAEAFHVTRRRVDQWVVDGCPRNADKTFNLYLVHKWILDKSAPDSGKDKKDEKLEWEIKRLQAQVSKIKEEFIERSEHETILSSRAKSLSIFLERAAIKNTVHYQGKTLEEMQNLRFREAQESMEAYLGKR